MQTGIARTSGVRDHITTGAVTAAAALALVVLLANYLPFPRFESDTAALFNEVRRMRTALAHGQWTGWGGQFPLLQKLPVLALQVAGIGDDTVLWVLAAASLLAFAGTLVLAWNGLRQSSRRLALLFLAVLLSGPLPWYARSTFGEMVAAFLTLAFIVACRQRADHALVITLFFLSGISKDIASPFLLFLGFAASTVNPGWQETGFRRSRLSALIFAAALTVAVVAAFTYVRYRSLANGVYLSSSVVFPGPRSQLSFFMGIWASPNGGLLFFWPSFCLLLALCALAVRQRALALPSAREGLRVFLPAATAAGTLIALTLGFAKFVAPLGWVAWGPRYMLPWLPAIGYLILSAYGAELETLVTRAGRTSIWVVAIVLPLISLPQFAVLFRPSLLNGIFAPDAICPTEAVVQQDPTYYYHCMNHMLWTKGSTLLGAYSLEPSPSALLFAGLCSILLFGLLTLARPDQTAKPAR